MKFLHLLRRVERMHTFLMRACERFGPRVASILGAQIIVGHRLTRESYR
jgi:hypothetical protein